MRWDAHRKKKFFLQKICEKKFSAKLEKKKETNVTLYLKSCDILNVKTGLDMVPHTHTIFIFACWSMVFYISKL